MKVETRKKIVFGLGGFFGLLGLILSIVAMATPGIFEFYSNSKAAIFGSYHSDAGMASVGAIFAMLASLVCLGFSGYKGHLVWTNKATSKNDEMIVAVLIVIAFALSVAAIACADKFRF